VEPVYLRAEQGELPELVRIIVAYGDQVVMGNTLEESLQVIFGDIPTQPAPPAASAAAEEPAAALPPDLTGLIQSALDIYEDGQQALQQGDWQRYGETQQDLEEILQQLQQQAD
jgi:uncharacterized membrane protein (UPF0182 family)